MSDASHDYTDAKVLQNWLSDVIGHLEALPEPTQIALGLALFKIGDEHFHWRADQIKSWHKERCRSLRQQLSELQREQWQSPVGALPSRFCAPSVHLARLCSRRRAFLDVERDSSESLGGEEALLDCDAPRAVGGLLSLCRRIVRVMIMLWRCSRIGQVIAKRLVELARAGECNLDLLCEGALKNLSGHLYSD